MALAVVSSVLLATPAHAAWSSEMNFELRIVTITGEEAADVITIVDTGTGVLAHDIPILSATDFDSAAEGVQQVPSDGSWQVVLRGGGGGDHITVNLEPFSAGPVKIYGDAGNDFLFGGGGVEHIFGGTDHDQITGGRSSDIIHAGSGNDVVIWSNGHGSDDVNGSTGSDAVEVYGSLTVGDAWVVSATIDGLRVDRTNFGLAHVSLASVEHVMVNGYGGDDTLSVDGAAGTKARISLAGHVGHDTLLGGSAGETLTGGEDQDTLSGAGGPDRLTGGGGADLINGGADNDVIDSRDGEVDDVRCGAGEDTVTADAEDQVRGCERVRL